MSSPLKQRFLRALRLEEPLKHRLRLHPDKTSTSPLTNSEREVDDTTQSGSSEQPCEICARTAAIIEFVEENVGTFVENENNRTTAVRFDVDVELNDDGSFAFKIVPYEGFRKSRCNARIGHYGQYRKQESCIVCREVVRVLKLEYDSRPATTIGLAFYYREERWALGGFETAHNLRYHLYLLRRRPLGTSTPFDESYIDRSLVQNWINTCDCEHAGHCHTIGNPWRRIAPPLDLLLIDVHRSCLVEQPESCKWVALSYCWGNQDSLQTTTANLGLLFQDGAFHRKWPVIPETIRNSMDFVASIGEKYLWVDRFCIIQDDLAYKNLQIKSMAAIYANAYFTIVAFDGRDDSWGLRGLEEHVTPRTPPWTRLYFSDSCRMTSYCQPSTNTRYATRGWTLQEFELSPRKLIFDKQTVRWQCEKSITYEHTSDVIPRVEGMISSSPKEALEWYWSMALTYCQRQLSRPGDRLNAFSAIVSVASRSLPGGILFGLPEMFFDDSLLWEARSSSRDGVDIPIERCRDAKGEILREFPSWSWLGWSRSILVRPSYQFHCFTSDPDSYIPASMEVWYKLYPIVKWYKSTTNDNSSRTPIANSYYENLGESNCKTPSGEVLPQGSRYVPPTEQPLPTDEDIWGPILSFRTRRLVLSFGRLLDESTDPEWFQKRKLIFSTGGTTYSDLVNAEGMTVGVLQLTSKDVPTGKPCELICISKGTMDFHAAGLEGRGYPERYWLHKNCPKYCYVDGCVLDETERLYRFYHVMWIEWKDGIAYRLAIGRVYEDFWDNADTEEIDVLLG